MHSEDFGWFSDQAPLSLSATEKIFVDSKLCSLARQTLLSWLSGAQVFIWIWYYYRYYYSLHKGTMANPIVVALHIGNAQDCPSLEVDDLGWIQLRLSTSHNKLLVDDGLSWKMVFHSAAATFPVLWNPVNPLVKLPDIPSLKLATLVGTPSCCYSLPGRNFNGTESSCDVKYWDEHCSLSRWLKRDKEAVFLL